MLFLSFSIFKLFSLVQNQCREDDLDNPVFQEVLSPGQTYLSAVKVSLKCEYSTMFEYMFQTNLLIFRTFIM